jgi:FkbM family methyltransferase
VINFWDAFDRSLRRNPYLPRFEKLRGLLRGPYHALMGKVGGLPLNIGGVFPIKVPAKYLIKEQAHYEVESCSALRSWIDKHPNATIVDIGCSYGFISSAALFHPNVRHVYAIDADRESLFITKQVCQYAPDLTSRLSLWNCLISEESSDNHGVPHVRNWTDSLLSSDQLTGDSRLVQYVNADTQISDKELPRITLSELLQSEKPNTFPMLVKCDVEGAELMVLKGSEQVFHSHRPTWLLSVHPNFLPRFNATVTEVREFFSSRNYHVVLLSTDHEEHWLCTPNNLNS